ncbi:hypothetical protein D3C87_1808750 [compost metagenome]
MVGTGFAGPLDDGGTVKHARVAAAGVVIVVFEEHGGRQHDIGKFGRFGHELFVHDQEQVLTHQPLPHQRLMRRHRGRIGVLNDHRMHRPAALQRFCVAGEDGADLGHVEQARRALLQMRALEA